MVESINIQSRDRADAERKLLQMYPHCEVLDCTEAAAGPAREDGTDLPAILSLISRQDDGDGA